MRATIIKLLPLLLPTFCILLTQFGGTTADSNSGCRDNERTALLKFKQGLTDPAGRLSSWAGLDCCKWAGVRCDNRTGHVTHLRLRNPSRFDDNEAIGGEISHSLVELKHLRYLDLSNNFVDGVIVPEFLGSLSRLRYLNLSGSQFVGKIPPQLGNLTNLRYLDLNTLGFSLDHMPMDWLSRLFSLKYLDLSGFNLTDSFEAISKLPALSVLILDGCSLNNIPSSNDPSSNDCFFSIPNWVFDIKSLETIDLTQNSLSGPISGFGNLSSLQLLRLGDNFINHTIPKAIGDLCNLQVLDLSNNGINADIFEVLEGLSGCAMNSLQTLDLQYNFISGKLPDWLGMFRNLSELHLDHNFLSGSIPESFGGLSSMRYMYLAHNVLEGSVPDSLGQLFELVVLDFSFNSLGGIISNAHLSNLTKLEALFLSSNSIALNFSFDLVLPFQLKSIHLASCLIGPRFPSWLKTQRRFSTIDISNGSISDSMPDWFWNLSSRIYYLNLSHNQLSGSIPASFAFSNIRIIDLRCNQFHGPLPRIDGGVEFLYLSDNSFSGDLLPVLNNEKLDFSILILSDNLVNGTIPQSICGMVMLKVLDLSSNLLTGEIPNCSKVPRGWSAFNFANNNLSGHIPEWIGSLTDLQLLHLSDNSLYGEMPSLRNCTKLSILDLGENKLEGNIPVWIGESLSSLKMLRLRSNKFDGAIPHQLSLLNDLQVLDLAKNNLTGIIPLWLGNLSAMASTKQMLFNIFVPFGFREESVDDEEIDISIVYRDSMLVALKGKELKYSNTLSLVVSLDLSQNAFSGEISEELMKLIGLQSLNLSGNQLTGRIPQEISYLQRLETLDLSKNQLSGIIPSSISSLNFLSHLNLSHNNLSGRIPRGNQLQTLDPSVYAGNNDLCGNPLQSKCSGDEPPQLPVIDISDGDESEAIWMYIGGTMGFVAGFWSIWGTLLLKKSWRVSYFKFIDSIQVRLCKI